MHIVLPGTGVQPIPPTGYGGVERTIYEYAVALRSAGHEATILPGAPRGSRLGEYRLALRLASDLAGRSYDVLHASTPVVANRLAWAGRPYVYTSHSRHWFEPGGATGRWGLFLERRAVRRAAGTVALTERLRGRMEEATGPTAGPKTVIPIGVDIERFRPDWSRRDGTVALGVGVVRPFKRWELAAAALKGTGVTFRLVGPALDAAYAERVRAAGDRVEVMGEVSEPELAAAFATADLLVHPSRVELLAGAVLQGLAAGLPVVGSEAVADLVPAGGGACAPAGAPDEMLVRFLREQALALLRSGETRRAAGEAARATAVARFSWPAVVAAHLAFYRSLAESGRLSR